MIFFCFLVIPALSIDMQPCPPFAAGAERSERPPPLPLALPSCPPRPPPLRVSAAAAAFAFSARRALRRVPYVRRPAASAPMGPLRGEVPACSLPASPISTSSTSSSVAASDSHPCVRARLLGRAPGPSSLAARLRPPSIVPPSQAPYLLCFCLGGDLSRDPILR